MRRVIVAQTLSDSGAVAPVAPCPATPLVPGDGDMGHGVEQDHCRDAYCADQAQRGQAGHLGPEAGGAPRRCTPPPRPVKHWRASAGTQPPARAC